MLQGVMSGANGAADIAAMNRPGGERVRIGIADTGSIEQKGLARTSFNEARARELDTLIKGIRLMRSSA
jgi:hypothetical protein